MRWIFLPEFCFSWFQKVSEFGKTLKIIACPGILEVAEEFQGGSMCFSLGYTLSGFPWGSSDFLPRYVTSIPGVHVESDVSELGQICVACVCASESPT